MCRNARPNIGCRRWRWHRRNVQIHPWLAQFVGMSPEDAHQVLEKRWAGVAAGPLLKVRDLLLGFGCTSLVVLEQHAWLGTERSPDDCDLFLIAEPIATERIDRLLNQHGLSGNKLFREFLAQFGGLREDPTIAGSFVRGDEESLRMVNQPWMKEEVAGYDDWEGSSIIYSARNGDAVLLHPSGPIAWWKGAERRIDHQADDFGEFLEYFVEYKQTDWPFDSYGP